MDWVEKFNKSLIKKIRRPKKKNEAKNSKCHKSNCQVDGSSNTIQSLDASTNTCHVSTLDATTSTHIATLDGSTNTHVTTLDCSTNTHVTSLDASTNTHVTTLDASINTPQILMSDASTNTHAGIYSGDDLSIDMKKKISSFIFKRSRKETYKCMQCFADFKSLEQYAFHNLKIHNIKTESKI